jgi:hypothetical protein
MKKKGHSAEQIIGKLREAEVLLGQGSTVGEVSHGGESMLAAAVLRVAYLTSLHFRHLDRFLSVSWLPILSRHH